MPSDGLYQTLVACFCALAALCTPVRGTWDGQPEQVHLSWHGDATQMWVTWVTLDLKFANESLVEFGESGLTKLANGTVDTFVDGGSEKRKIYIHRVCMTNLTPNTRYFYHVGSHRGWSNLFWFKSLPAGSDWTPRIGVFGDLGNINGISIAPLQEESQRGHFDLIWHVGDLAYNLDTDNARYGDAFFRQMEPLAAYVPYQGVVGNHEYAYNFSNYKARFTMPKNGDGENMFYSYNVGPAHVIVYSSEFYYFVGYGWEQIANQYVWLENDLMEAAKPKNRAVRPWIITMAHRPMYCTNTDGDDCTKTYDVLRTGLPGIHAYGLEALFFKYGVDLNLFAHEHSYERLWPVYDQEVFNGSTQYNPYDNPGAPVHITSGSAGCQEYIDHFQSNPPPWSAVRISDYGYGHLNILNKTHIYWEQVSATSGKVVDKLTLIKREDNHGNYENNKIYQEKKKKKESGKFKSLIDILQPNPILLK